MKISQMKIKVKVKGIFFTCIANGDWWYWLYNNTDYTPWHFTLDASNQNAKFLRFHLTIDPGGGHTAGLRYFVNYGARTLVYDGLITNQFPQTWRNTNRGTIGNLLQSANFYHQAALAFCNKHLDGVGVNEPLCTAVTIGNDADSI
jgi:hypothetical protein